MRIRTLKPDFFKDEKLAEFSGLHRLFFQGLWLVADREGRLEDRPRFLKAEIFPYDDFNVESALDEFSRAGFILRYEAEGKKYIQVKNFLKHQRPNHREPKSEIPAQACTGIPGHARVEGKGREIEGKGREGESAPPQFETQKQPEVLAHFERVYVEKLAKQVILTAEDVVKSQQLVRTYGITECKKAIDRYFSEGDDFVRKKGFPFWLFFKQSAEFFAGGFARGSPENDAAILKRVEEEIARESCQTSRH